MSKRFKYLVLGVTCLAALPLFAIAKEQTNTAFNSGVSLYGQRNYKAAAQQFEAAIQANPNNADAVYYCALSQQQSNNTARARQLFEYITQRFPQSRVAPLAQTALNQLSSMGTAGAGTTGSSGADNASASASSTPGGSRQTGGDADLANVPDLVRIPFEKKSNDVIVMMQVNGRAVPFCLDTGAATVAVGMNHLKEWGITTSQGKQTFEVGGVGDGKAKGWIQRLDLKLGPIYRKDFPCQVQDNMPTDPLLGQTFLRSFNVNIDDNTRMVLLAKKGGSAARDIAHKSYYAKEVPFTRGSGGHMWVDAKVNGKAIKMIFDTGAEQTAFSSGDWQKLGLSIPENAQQGISRGVLGESTAYFFTVDSLKLGPIEQNNAPIHIIEGSKAPPLLGMSFYGKLKVAIDTNRNVIIFNEQ